MDASRINLVQPNPRADLLKMSRVSFAGASKPNNTSQGIDTEASSRQLLKQIIRQLLRPFIWAKQRVELFNLSRQNTYLKTQTQTPLKTWFKQFETQKDKATVIKLLKHFDYYDANRFREAMVRQHDTLMTKLGADYDLDKAKFTHFAVGKSGGLVQYFYRQANTLSNQSVMSFERAVKPQRIDPDKPIETLVVLEDFLGSGAEANYFFGKLDEALKENNYHYKNIVFMPAVAYQEGIDLLNEKYPWLDVIADRVLPKVMDVEHPDFSESDQRDIEALVNKYDHVYPNSLYNRPDITTPFGYRNGQSLVGFFFNTPSNTLPIFWSEFSDWQPLLQRFESFNKDTGEWAFPKYKSE